MLSTVYPVATYQRLQLLFDAMTGWRDVLQSRIAFADGTYLVRVFVDVDRRPAEVVTIYRTSHIARYWRAEP